MKFGNVKLPKELWMCEDEQARWFEFEEPFDLPDAVTVTKMVPAREWVGLTEEEIQTLWRSSEHMTITDVCRAIEAKLKEKNA